MHSSLLRLILLLAFLASGVATTSAVEPYQPQVVRPRAHQLEKRRSLEDIHFSRYSPTPEVFAPLPPSRMNNTLGKPRPSGWIAGRGARLDNGPVYVTPYPTKGGINRYQQVRPITRNQRVLVR
jgi:hypothetical protein